MFVSRAHLEQQKRRTELCPKHVYLRGNPSQGLAELVIAPGDHTCTVVRLTREHIQQLSAMSADFAWKWRD